ncbi:MAG: 2-phosphosulfolactate phosphatase [Candidatus Diapherotrites archaeon]|nr:2-phosphosulfolactate phosphatase [Candidatus Diapherotrites archaeon]
MGVAIECGPENARMARERGDQVIVVDSLRACSTIVTALDRGATKVIPVEAPKEARAYTGRDGFATAGERGGQKIDGLDFGNSPVELSRADLKGRALVLTTTNGTRCIRAAGRGCLIGSLLNASAVAAEVNGRTTIIVAGRNGAPSPEDVATAEEIASAACGTPTREEFTALFMASAAGKRLSQLGYSEDVKFCARKDVYDVVAVFDGEAIFLYDHED